MSIPLSAIYLAAAIYLATSIIFGLNYLLKYERFSALLSGASCKDKDTIISAFYFILIECLSAYAMVLNPSISDSLLLQSTILLSAVTASVTLLLFYNIYSTENLPIRDMLRALIAFQVFVIAAIVSIIEINMLIKIALIFMGTAIPFVASSPSKN